MPTTATPLSYRVEPPSLDPAGMIYHATEQHGVPGVDMLRSSWDARHVTLADAEGRTMARYKYGVDRDGVVWFELVPKPMGRSATQLTQSDEIA